MQQIFIFGGPNGAGKTTSALTLLPDLLECDEYVNADAIAAALSPFHPEATSIQAGRLMLDRITHLAAEQKNFAFETTMSSRSFLPFLKKCKNNGYQINLLFLWLQNVQLAKTRVALRVQMGGHNIQEDVIERHYEKGLRNFIDLYLPVADSWIAYNNSFEEATKIAERRNEKEVIYQKDIWAKFKPNEELI